MVWWSFWADWVNFEGGGQGKAKIRSARREPQVPEDEAEDEDERRKDFATAPTDAA